MRVPDDEPSGPPLSDGRGPGVDCRIVVATGICFGCGGCGLEEKPAWFVLRGCELADTSFAAVWGGTPSRVCEARFFRYARRKA